MPHATGGADNLSLVLFEMHDRSCAQAEYGQARDILGSCRIARSERRNVRVIGLDFELRPGDLR